MPTRALFEAVAKILRTSREHQIHKMRNSRSKVLTEDDVEELFYSLTVSFGQYFEEANQRFDWKRFREASGAKL